MKTRLLILLALLCSFSLPLMAEGIADVRHRIEQRLAQIDALKAQEAVGETNRGFLEERKTGVANAASIVAAENKDRETVYAYIARETGANADSVGRARAKQIAANSKPGVWVQDEGGRWIKK